MTQKSQCAFRNHWRGQCQISETLFPRWCISCANVKQQARFAVHFQWLFSNCAIAAYHPTLAFKAQPQVWTAKQLQLKSGWRTHCTNITTPHHPSHRTQVLLHCIYCSLALQPDYQCIINHAFMVNQQWIEFTLYRLLMQLLCTWTV